MLRQWKPGKTVVFDEEAFGYPYPSLGRGAAGRVLGAGIVHVYETFDLSTGHTVKLPMDNGEGQQWNKSPGNLYSHPF